MTFPGKADIVESYAKVLGYFRKRITRPDDVDDLTQEVIYRAVKNYDSLRRQESYQSWIFGICRNVLYQHNREKKRRFLGLEIPFDDRSFDRIDIRLILAKLPERYQTIYRQFYVQRRKIAEIARTTGIPEGTVKFMLYDLRKRVKGQIEERRKGADST
jgi:RNA polymerase sigma-70 factor, ECF subfamily